MARAPHQRGGGADLPEVEISMVNLRQVIGEVKAISPKMARNLRRGLREAGDGIISDQKSELSKPLPGNAVKTGMTVRRIGGGGGRKGYLRSVNTYKAEDAKRSRSRGMRAGIRASLKTRVVAGVTRSGISIRADKNVGGVMTKVWNKKVFRHPVYSNGLRKKVYVTQYGQPYWWDPIKKGREDAQQKARQAITDALNGKG